MSRRSAGILLFSAAEGKLRVLLVHPGGPLWVNKDAGAWSIPKGEYGEDEDPRAAALREFREETGLDLAAPDLIDLGQVKQKGGKVVSAWAAEGDFDVSQLRSNDFEMQWPPKSGVMRRFPEVDRAQWCDPDTARQKILPAQAELIDRLITALGAP
jgi:predicted NUDIX family NTP pyrophosphohydrolase